MDARKRLLILAAVVVMLSVAWVAGGAMLTPPETQHTQGTAVEQSTQTPQTHVFGGREGIARFRTTDIAAP